TTLAANQDQLEELDAKEAAIHAEEERKRVAAEQRKAAEEQRKAAEQEQTKVEVASAPKQAEQKKSNTTTTSRSQKKPTPSNEKNENQENKDQSGSWMSIQSTGYSTQEPGLSTHTATGIDLRVNPRVIAVDPSVIPLGSLVEIQGLGVYVAGDTGGAINGRIIDIHFS